MRLARTALISVSEVCSIGCAFCFRADRGNSNMSIGTLTRSLSRLADLGIRDVCLTGGEPTHHPRFLQAVRAVRQFGLGCSVVTSANSPLACNRLQRLSHIMQHVTLSVDSVGASTIGRVNRSLGNAVALSKRLHPRSMGINFVFYRLSESEAEVLAQTCEQRKLSIELSPLLLTRQMRMRASIDVNRYIETLHGDLAILTRHLRVSKVLQAQLSFLEAQVLTGSDAGLCACDRLFVSPRGEVRLCPYSEESTSVWAPRKELRSNIAKNQKARSRRQLNCLFYCASEAN